MRRRCRLLALLCIAFVLPGASTFAQPAPLATPAQYSINMAIAKGVINARMSLFNATDQKHVLDTIQELDPGKVTGDTCEIRPDGKSEYDAVTCGDIPAIKQALAEQR